MSCNRSELMIAVAIVAASTANAGTFVGNPDRLWPNGVVNYRMDASLREVSYCEDSSPMVACDPEGDPEDNCSIFVACLPLTNGNCLGGDSADLGYPACDTTNGDADCDAAGVTDGQCVITTTAGPCVAMERWAAEANLTFREISCVDDTPACPGFPCIEGVPDHYIAWKATSGVSSSSDSIGRNPEGPQSINVRLTTNVSGWGQAHELGHALGLYHEQCRRDRDDFVTPNMGNVTGVSTSNWDIENGSQHFPRAEHGVPEPFDFGSLMMYALCRFSSCGDSCGNDSDLCVNDTADCRTMEIDVTWSGSDSCCGVPTGDPCIGQRNHFSTYDAMTMRFLYPEAGWRFVDAWYDGDDETGTFQQPQTQFLDGVDVTPNGGTLWVLPASYYAVDTITKPMTILAPIGPVTLGD
jgi:hypothetical protein